MRSSQVACTLMMLLGWAALCSCSTEAPQASPSELDEPASAEHGNTTRTAADPEETADMSDTAARSDSAQGAAPKHTNRLVHETSPYLLQHAHNPVDWYPWGEEAFAAAREQDKPIFLSVGYSTCYWCHVMERESFENEDVAKLMNEHFICIKVDREERPDVDDIYMMAVQLQSGGGGWPMSVFMEPQKLQPFFGGTYFPLEPRSGAITFPELLRRIAAAWKDQREDLERQAAMFAERITEMMSERRVPRTLTRGDVERAAALLLSSYDSAHGGFGGGQARAPKFPMPTNIVFLFVTSWDNPAARDAALRTLNRMAMGGIYDHVGGGFHRYSVDAQWQVPHFEKMLYDNAQLASTYAAAFKQTNDPYYARVLRQTLDYVLREMTDARGGFYSAQDAEVNQREGQNYLWRPEEIEHVLDVAGLTDSIEFALDVYGLADGPNFQDPHHPEDGRFDVLHLDKTPAELAAALSMSLDEFFAKLDAINTALLAARDLRDQPALDDKLLSAWNGLMIAGMADGGRVLGEPRYIDAAERAAAFVLDALTDDGDRLLRTYRNGEARIDGFLEDYAFVIHGLLGLHRATMDSRWLEEAVALAAVARELFWDDSAGGYFDTLADQSDLFVRSRSTYDGAVPSGTGVMLNNLLTLHERTGDARHLADATATLRSVSAQIVASPTQTIVSTLALHRYLQSHDAAALVGEPISVEMTSETVALSIVEHREQAAEDVLARFDLRLEVRQPWHINAHEPGDASLVGLSIDLVGVQGLEIELDYPEGEPFAGPIEGMRVHSGTVVIPVTIRQTAEQVQGRPQLVVKWQACDNTVCREPEQQVITLSGG